jgi:hypothetical protein
MFNYVETPLAIVWAASGTLVAGQSGAPDGSGQDGTKAK